MFKERIVATLKKIGFFFGVLACGVALLVAIYFLVSINEHMSDKVMKIIIAVMFGVMILVFVVTVISYIIIYLNWQFIEPFKDWKNGRRKKNG